MIESLLKKSRILILVLFSSVFSSLSANAQCDPNNLYDAIICAYHQSIALRSDGTYSCWGQLMGNNGTTAVLSPQDINPTNYTAMTGTSILAATASSGSGGSEQSVLLTTTGLFAWGTEGVILNNAITSSTTFQKVTINGQTNGLPVGVNPSDVVQLFATMNTLAFVTSSGSCYVLNCSTGASILGDNSATVNSAWHKVLTAAGTPLTDVVAVRGQFVSATKNALMALTDDGTTKKVYTWGASTYLGNATAASVKSFATQMTLPVGLNVKMIGCTGGNSATRNNTYFVLGTNGSLYSLGANDMRQCGDRTTTERTSWVFVKRPDNTNFTDVKYISVQEHDAKVPAGALVTNSGDLYLWGESDGMMLGVVTNGSYDPFLPGGFTSGVDIARLVELGGHTTVYMRENSAKFCYVGHRVSGSMGDGTATNTNEPTFNCSSTPVLNICGSTGWDYGDAPVNYENGGGSNLALNFYVEEEFNLYLGTTPPIDGDETTQNVIIGTDNNGSQGDGLEENAVTTFPPMSVSNTSYSLSIPVKNNTGLSANVYAWVDWNNNFVFESTEYAGAVVPTNVNSQNVTLNWTGISGLENGRRYVRIRISTYSLTNNAATQVDERALGFLADGEIEDFNIIISDPNAAPNVPPQTNNVTNGALIQATDGPLPIDDFSSLDSDGTVVAYRINTLPAHGTLYIYDGVVLIPVSLYQAMTTATAASLFYDPNLTWNGSDSFTYSAIDNDGSEDATPATYFLAQCVNDADGDGICDQDEIPGCQTVGACNYNPLATDSNGSCVFGTTYYVDADGDGFGNPLVSVQACTQPTGYVTNNTDCNDASASINPTTVWYLDADVDGYYVSTSVSCTSPGANYNTTGGTSGDCNDNNAAVNAAATEVCNGIDDNCNGQIDEGVLLTFYADVDGDGYGDAGSSVQACSAPTGYVTNNTDCNDASASINPTTVWYLDADGDGYYVSTSVSCTSPGANYNTTGGTSGDCNDNNAAVNAAATEVCNGIDDNCNGQIDEGVLLTFYADVDGDGYGDAGSSVQACSAPTGYVTNNTDCNDASASINPTTVWYLDADVDGYYVSTSVSCTSPGANYNTTGGTSGDCNDNNAAVNAAATEVCNGIDDNCNGQIDEGVLLTFYADVDGDGYGDAGSSVQACSAPTGYVTNNTDCNDASAAINPTTVWYLDADGDGYYVSTSVSCTSPGANYNTTGGTSGDCNDNNAAVNAAATEVCNGIDDNCNGQIDEGVLLTFYADVDGDGYGDAGSSVQACSAPTGYVTNNTDCNDASASINPTTVWYLDADGDGYYVSTSVSCTSPGANYNTTGGTSGDCNDNNAAVNAAATEVCNGIDDNCNGQIDEGVLLTFYADVDGDGYGDAGSSVQACSAPTGYVTNNTDCNDASASINPTTVWYLDADVDGYYVSTSVSCTSPGANYNTTGGTSGDCNDNNAAVNAAATEVCNGIDDNCNGQIDEGVLLTFYADVDGDGYGDAGSSVQACSAPTGYVTNNTDCNDASASINPTTVWYLDADGDGYYVSTSVSCTSPGANYNTTGGTSGDCNDNNAAVNAAATEVCNGIDDNCNGQIDEGVLLTFYADVDGDGYGDAGSSVQACSAPSGYVSDNTDCNDASASINPTTVWYLDVDGDGYYVSTSVSCTSPGANYNTTGGTSGDCNDNNAAVNAAATEVCNGIDDNCNGQIDEGVLLTFYADVDGDGYGDAGSSVQACSAPTGYVTNNTDCNDASASINPTTVWYLDADGDGYYVSTSVSCTSPGANYNTTGGTSGDCNDNNAAVNAAATEVCNGIDDNCNGQIDEGVLLTFYADVDGDGYGDAGSSVQACSAPTGYVTNNTDCNDASASINPTTVWYLDADVDGYYVSTSVSCTSPGANYNTTGGTSGDCNDNNAAVNAAATEVCNGIDDNCNGQIDEGVLLTFYADVDGDGYGDAGSSVQACSAPTGYVTNNTDCNDASASINPTTVWYLDADGDGYYVSTSVSCTSPGANYNTTGGTSGDCNDNNAAVNAAATEVCNGIDDNCNGQIDELPTLDCDNDGLILEEETNNGTDPLNPDTDGDGVIDSAEVTDATNPQDPCSLIIASQTVTPTAAWLALDCDGDGTPNVDETGTDPLNPDTDGDGVTDTNEILDGTNPNDPCSLIIASQTVAPSAAWLALDCDGDGTPNVDETGTDPLNPDTDGDGVTDTNEILDGTNPNDPCSLIIASQTVAPSAAWLALDCDGDGTPNVDETGTDPLNPDTDGDGVTDTNEILDGTNPNDPCSLIIASQTVAPSAAWLALDCDGDGTPNVDETGTDPLNPDTDGDGVTDTNEILDGTNPNDPCSLIIASQTVAPSAAWLALDCDGDGTPNVDETGTDPLNPDTDGDGVTDTNEIPDGTNPNDPCSLIIASQTVSPSIAWVGLDCDNDGLDNGAELANNTDVFNPDTDGDGVTDGGEVGDVTDPLNPCSYNPSSVTLTPSTAWLALDCDSDGLNNGDELTNNTDVFNPDTDGDGVLDGTEVNDSTNPTDPCDLLVTSITLAATSEWLNLDCDNDGLTNGNEVALGTEVFNQDTDGDGVIDGTEIADQTLPLDPCSLELTSITLTQSAQWGDLDCDNDGVSNSLEATSGIDPFNPDTDGDGVIDGTELVDLTNALDPCDYLTANQTVTPSSEWDNLDCDGDGLTNLEELNANSDPNDPCSPVSCDLTIPQAITPNGDGYNDVFVIDGIEQYPNNELVIFNRWGAEVFRATNYQNDWDGKSTNNLNVWGEDLPTGTYYYLFDTKTDGEKAITGFIYLTR